MIIVLACICYVNKYPTTDYSGNKTQHFHSTPLHVLFSIRIFSVDNVLSSTKGSFLCYQLHSTCYMYIVFTPTFQSFIHYIFRCFLCFSSSFKDNNPHRITVLSAIVCFFKSTWKLAWQEEKFLGVKILLTEWQRLLYGVDSQSMVID